jgi:hypothetical protein
MKSKFIFIFILSLSIFSISCYDKLTDNPLGNLPPNTYSFLYPDSTISSQPSRLNVYWSGDDPDGFILGFYFSWDNVNWTFTTNNDSLFALQIGVVDTNYIFQVSAVDNGGNGVYDDQITQNGINYGREPFVDNNGNGIFDNGEKYYDIGLIDPTPASIKFPIKNSAPIVFWNSLSFLPDTSFPAMTFGWEAEDIDGNASIEHINIALNDTTNYVQLNGGVRRIAIRTKEFTSSNPLMDILLDGNPNNLASVKLPGLQLNSFNVFYVQAIDISGAKSPFISLPNGTKNWFVKKPKGQLLIIDNSNTADNAPTFYNQMMDSLSLSGKFDVYDILSPTQVPPYINITFLETIKLFGYSIWYSDNNPSLDLANASVPKYLDGGGKILLSLQFPQNVDLTVLQGFLPIIADSSDSRSSLFSGVKISASLTQPSYPELVTTSTLFRARSFYLGQLGAIPIYYFPNQELKGYIGFFNSVKSEFFIGLPLHRLNGGSANVKALLSKVLFEDFGLIP